jgi:hypothetical protein
MTAPVSRIRGVLTNYGRGPVDGDDILCTLTLGTFGTLWSRVAEGRKQVWS